MFVVGVRSVAAGVGCTRGTWHVEQYHAMDLLTFDYTSVLAADACFFDLIDMIDVIDMLDM